MPRRTAANEPQLKFYQRLILNRWLLKQFGADDWSTLAEYMKHPQLEEIDGEGSTGFYKELLLRFHGEIRENALARYDRNIVFHIQKINDKRAEPLVLKYFQYLTLLFTEYYLDRYFNDRQGLLSDLNEYLDDFNKQYPNDAYKPFTVGDINKIAVWNATGSGKTLIMHINYYQYDWYSEGKLPDDASYILLTPKEGLSRQHVQDYAESGITARIYDKSASRWTQDKNEINVLENTKLGDKDQETVVSVKRFGNRNVVFVDEGHRGSSSGKDGKWQKYRDELCSAGFSFEYSATFGQAIAAAGDKSLLERYGKCIIFDYSYKYFYKDGYGKDYNIINLPDDSDKRKRELYLTGCLMAYYQQKKLYLEKQSEYVLFNIENPLFVFVGTSVNAVPEDKRKVSDVVDILMFFRNFVTDTETFTKYIECLLSGNTGFIDDENRDIFRNRFEYLNIKYLNAKPSAVYADVLKSVFNCAQVGAALHIENLRGVSGEIRLRLGENEPFGVINVGDDSKLLKLCSENGFNTASIDFSDSLFERITKPGSTINMLIGSKKFTEGWNCWRVSTMGLMNVGRSEGSEIIQLFGRGVRLKGRKMSLKRSTSYKKDHPEIKPPEHIDILETLNIFGVRADYMKQFRDFLEKEDVPSEKGKTAVLNMPVIRNQTYKGSGLYSLGLKENVDFKKDAEKQILKYCEKDNIHVVLDCYSKVQAKTSQDHGRGEITKNSEGSLEKHLAFLNYDAIYSELQRYKMEKARYNVIITRENLTELLKNKNWYTLLIPERELEVQSFEDYKRFDKLATALLTKYFDRFYYHQQNSWESGTVGYKLVPMRDDSDNFFDEYSIIVESEDKNTAVKKWIEDAIEEIKKAKEENSIPNFSKPCQGDMKIANIPEHLYNPLLYLAKGNVEIGVFPVALNESEFKFVTDFKKHIDSNKEYFSNKDLYLIRNRSRKGLGFFDDVGFFPDFIMWLLADDKQHIVFIEPHGMTREVFNSKKVELYKRLESEIKPKLAEQSVTLTSFVLSATKYNDIPDKSRTKEQWIENHVLFMEEGGYIETMFKKLRI